MRKTPLFLLLASLLAPYTLAEELTTEEKEIMLSKIEAMENKVLDINQSSQKSAISVFRAAMNSDAETFKLYLACKEKIALEEQKKKGGDVRDSLRKIKDRSSKEFKRGLRHQLFWLVYSIEAARDPDARMQSAQKLVECMANIVHDVKVLDRQTTLGGNPLKQNPFSSVFAKAYKVDHLKPEAWPSSPLDFNGLFKGLIMKNLIEQGDFGEARKQWASRLNAERSLITAYADDPDSSKFGNSSVELENYLSQRAPALMWEGERVLYEGGDTRDAAIALFGILEKYPDHPNYLSWVEWFKGALSGEGSESTEERIEE